MANVLEPAKQIFSGGLSSYFWIIASLAVLGIIGAVIWWLKKFKKKNTQWTHKLIIIDELQNGGLDMKERVVRMRRWKHKDENTPPLFELERPVFGSRIFVELEEYCGPTSYKIVAGIDGRIYIPIKTVMSKDKKALEVSVKHAGIDRARQQYNNRFEQMNATPSKIDALTLMKYGLIGAGIIVILVLGIVGLKSWGERASYDAAAAQAEVQSWEAMAETGELMNSVMNTITLILPDLKDKYGNNIQGAIKVQKEALNQS